MDCKNRIIKLAGKHGIKPEGLLQVGSYTIPDDDRVGIGQRHAPDYVLWLLEYYIRNEGLVVKEMNEGGGDSEKETT